MKPRTTTLQKTKNKMKKKLIKIALMLAVATTPACSTQKLDPEPVPDINTNLSFATVLEQHVGLVKGAAKETFTIGDQFFVYGVNTDVEDFNPEKPNAVDYVFSAETTGGIQVLNIGKNNEGADQWQYGKPVVWLPGKSTFFAFAPAPYAGQNFGITQPSTKFPLNSIPKITFTVAGGYDPATATPEEITQSRLVNKTQVDLVAAYAPNQSSGTPVLLTFEHKLARITFAVRPMQTVGFIRINAVTLKNVQTSATLRLDGQWDPTSLTRTRDFSLTLKNDAVNMIPATPEQTYAINDGLETLCMIPQTLTGLVLEIKYAYSIDGIIWPDYQNGKTISVQLDTISSAWTQATCYNYILNIDPK